MKQIDITFPRPCGENWESMTPRGCDRFCASCSNTVHDLAALSPEQVGELLERDEDVCVRAHLARDGSVRTRDSSKQGSPTRVVATLGSSMTLALAACQSVPPIPEGERYAISGGITTDSRGEIVARSKEGWEFRTTTDSEGHFVIDGVPPSTYSIALAGDCAGMNSVTNITVSGEAVDIGMRDWDDGGCYIVGVVERRRR